MPLVVNASPERFTGMAVHPAHLSGSAPGASGDGYRFVVGVEQVDAGLLDEFQYERGLPAFSGHEQHIASCSGQGNLEQPAVLGIRESVRGRHSDLEQRVVLDGAGEARATRPATTTWSASAPFAEWAVR